MVPATERLPRLLVAEQLGGKPTPVVAEYRPGVAAPTPPPDSKPRDSVARANQPSTFRPDGIRLRTSG